jgi:putative ABC transport system permease protein
MLISHCRLAWRLATARPWLSLLRIVTIALVIAAGSAVLTVASATLLRPLPFPDDGRLMRVNTLPPGITDFAQANPLHPLEFVRLRERLRSVEAFEGLWARDRSLTGDGEPESVPAASVSAGFFALLGGVAVAGRSFTEDEARQGAKLVVLSHGLWTRRFGANPAVVGRTVLIDRQPYEITGVMPAGFESAYVRAELWTPLEVREGNLVLPGATFIQTLARLKSSASQAELAQELDGALAAVREESPGTLNGWSIRVRTLRSAQFGSQRPAIVLLLVAVFALSLIATANLGNLTLADVLQRRGELAVRSALGATRSHLLWPELLQSAMLATAGTAAGVVAGAWLLPVVIALDPANELASASLRVDWRVLAVTLVLAATIMAAASAVPTLRTAGTDVVSALAENGRRTAGSGRAEQMRAWLVAAQTALALVLLVSGALLAGAFDRTARTEPGFDPSGVLTAQLRLPESVYNTADKRAAFAADVVSRVRALPGIIDASTTMNLFVPGFAFQTLVHVEGQPTPDGQPHTVQFRRTGPGYFRTMRIRIIRGREFDQHDTVAGMPVLVVSRSFAARFWPGEHPIGKRVRRSAAGSPWLTIVGVVDDVRDVGFGQAAQATVYTPYAQNNVAASPISLVVRTVNRDALASADAVKGAVWQVDPTQPLASVGTLDRFLSDSLGPQRFRTVLLNLLATLGLALAALGIYGVTTRTVVERTREAGVRLALGGAPRQVWITLAARPLRAFAAGAAAGTVASLIAATALTKIFPEISGGFPLYTAGALGILLACGVTAAMVAARRVTRLDPLTALRA